MGRSATCPLCQSNEILNVIDVPIKGTEKTRSLWTCTMLNRWFWEDTGEEAEGLWEMCVTRWRDRDLCNEKILDMFVPDGQVRQGLEASREYDQICGECKNKAFVLDK